MGICNTQLINLNELGIKEKITNKLRCYNKFRTGVLGEKKEKQNVSELDIRNYAKHILNNGTILEKQDITKRPLTNADISINLYSAYYNTATSS